MGHLSELEHMVLLSVSVTEEQYQESPLHIYCSLTFLKAQESHPGSLTEHITKVSGRQLCGVDDSRFL